VASAGAAVAAGGFWATAGFVGVLIGKGMVTIGEEWLDLVDRRKTTNPEVAFVHAARRHLRDDAA
jgi:hypothetical protein